MHMKPAKVHFMQRFTRRKESEGRHNAAWRASKCHSATFRYGNVAKRCSIHHDEPWLPVVHHSDHGVGIGRPAAQHCDDFSGWKNSVTGIVVILCHEEVRACHSIEVANYFL